MTRTAMNLHKLSDCIGGLYGSFPRRPVQAPEIVRERYKCRETANTAGNSGGA